MSEKHTSRRTRETRESEMRPEYDFTGAVRGKYYKRYLEGTNVVILEPDVAKRFKTSAAVNKVLRTYLKGGKRGPTARSTRTRAKAARAG